MTRIIYRHRFARSDKHHVELTSTLKCTFSHVFWLLCRCGNCYTVSIMFLTFQPYAQSFRPPFNLALNSELWFMIKRYSCRNPQSFCYSSPGQHNGLINSGAKEQLMVIARGTYGCLDGSLRSIMKYLAILVGRRNEHQRGDRDQYISVNQANIGVTV